MTVITIASAPPSLRGDLTKWLFEVSPGVYIGRLGARVRDELWERVRRSLKNGKATMVWSTNNEQGLDFRVHNSDWIPIDYDGLKLMMRPGLDMLKQTEQYVRPSDASRFMMARRRAARCKSDSDYAHKENALIDALPESADDSKDTNVLADLHLENFISTGTRGDYTVIDIETTGLSAERDAIIELAALRIRNGQEADTFQALIAGEEAIPPVIERLTGISARLLHEQGKPIAEILPRFLEFIGSDLIVSHNVSFDMAFLNAACARFGLARVTNATRDTFKLSKKALYNLRRHRLADVAEHLGVRMEEKHRGLVDCRTVHAIYEKLETGDMK